ncbi:MAG: metallophosphoesterase [Flavobacteriaceae bacterium]|nr:metallophosphoesterase [Flavobacteriaceae bacterium]
MLIYNHALHHYYEKDFVYIEAGDGIELWENKSFEPIYKSHRQSFDLIKKFGQNGRLFMLWGNHDMEFRDPILVERIMNSFIKPKNISAKDALFDLKYYESLLLEFPEINKSIFVLHGHQADYMNYTHWKFNRFFVRHFWKYLQRWFGINDPTSPAKNYKNLIRVEKKLNEWIVKNKNQMIITGHTHRPRFPDPGELPHFNDGSCVHPDCIIGLEIVGLKIALVKWQQNSNSAGINTFEKVVLAGPKNISDFI